MRRDSTIHLFFLELKAQVIQPTVFKAVIVTVVMIASMLLAAELNIL